MSALPSARARLLAFAAIVAAGVCGALIGYALVDLQCEGNCGVARAVGTVAGGAIAALGVAVIAVLTLRALGEWKRISSTAGDENSPRETG